MTRQNIGNAPIALTPAAAATTLQPP
jgi:hypothetical protein